MAFKRRESFEVWNSDYVCVCVVVQWGSVENRLAVGTADDVYIVTEHLMSLHCCGAVSCLILLFSILHLRAFSLIPWFCILLL